MIERIAAEVPRPAAVIVGEPTSMKVMTAHKGITVMETTVTGHEAHSSQTHRGVSAVMAAARLVSKLDEMARVEAGNTSALPFEPPFTTIHVGTIDGGTAANIISRRCRFVWDIRHIPEDDPMIHVDRFNAWCESEVLPGMRSVAPEAGIETRMLNRAPAFGPEESGRGRAHRPCDHRRQRRPCRGLRGGAGQFQEAGFSTVICGPGSIDQAHQPNEFIELDQIGQCERFLRRLMDDLSR